MSESVTNLRVDLPPLTHQRLIKPLFPLVSTENMRTVLKSLTSFYNRYYGGVTGERSAVWLHDQLSAVPIEQPSLSCPGS